MLERTQNLGLGPVLLWIWVAFTSLYFLGSVTYPYIDAKNIQSATNNGYANGYNTAANDALKSFSGNAYQNGQNNGYLTAFANLGQALHTQVADGCKQAIPVNLGTGTALGVVNVVCLQQTQSGKLAPASQK